MAEGFEYDGRPGDLLAADGTVKDFILAAVLCTVRRNGIFHDIFAGGVAGCEQNTMYPGHLRSADLAERHFIKGPVVRAVRLDTVLRNRGSRLVRLGRLPEELHAAVGADIAAEPGIRTAGLPDDDEPVIIIVMRGFRITVPEGGQFVRRVIVRLCKSFFFEIVNQLPDPPPAG